MIQIGSKKVTKLIVGGNTMINRDDVWLPCGVSPDFSGTPILMKNDKQTGITTFLGQIHMNNPISATSGTWFGTLLTLPAGYHFSEISVNFPLSFENRVSAGYQSYSIDGSNLNCSFKWPLASPAQGLPSLAFGYINSVSPSQASAWHTTTVAPD